LALIRDKNFKPPLPSQKSTPPPSTIHQTT
jgi:hypothetical protein